MTTTLPPPTVEPSVEPSVERSASARPSRGLIAGLAAFVLVVAATGYAWRGQPAGWAVGPGQAMAAADDVHQGDAQLQGLIARLAQRLQAQPDDADGWALLGRSYSALGRLDEALPAYRRVVALRPRDAQALADLADVLGSTKGSLDGEPAQLIAQALALDGKHLKALALDGTIAFNRGDHARAIARWEQALAAAGDAQPAFAEQLRGALADARARAAAMPAAPASAAANPR